MEDRRELAVVARMRSDFTSKFGIPRQSGLSGVRGEIVFEGEFRNAEALRGIEEYSHLWLIWGFSAIETPKGFSATVRPPRLGGNTRVGVFATRSPFRPNALGLSSVRLLGVERREGDGDVLIVEGADLMDGTPIYDVKPYIPFSDAHSNARTAFSDDPQERELEVCISERLSQAIPSEKLPALIAALRQDPRPAYQSDPGRVYGFPFAGREVCFKVTDGILTVTDIKTP